MVEVAVAACPVIDEWQQIGISRQYAVRRCCRELSSKCRAELYLAGKSTM